MRLQTHSKSSRAVQEVELTGAPEETSSQGSLLRGPGLEPWSRRGSFPLWVLLRRRSFPLWVLLIWPSVVVTSVLLVLTVVATIKFGSDTYLDAVLLRASYYGWLAMLGYPIILLHVLSLLCRFCGCCYQLAMRQCRHIRQMIAGDIRRWKLIAGDSSVLMLWWGILAISSAMSWGQCGVPHGQTTFQHTGGAEWPSDFMFGAGTAAFQVEGNLPNTNWFEFQEKRKDMAPVGMAADMFERFYEDLELMKQLELQSYRFSVEWSRVEPTEGAYNFEALGRYRDWCRQLKLAGIRPMVTLHHYTEPLWVTRDGSWENSTIVRRWISFVKVVVKELRDDVDTWVTLNEPVVFGLLGWVQGRWPPGKTNAWGLWLDVFEHLLQAHLEAYEAIHELDSNARVGIAHNINRMEPASFLSLLDTMTAGGTMWVISDFFLRELSTRRQPFVDYMGINHYFRITYSVSQMATGGKGINFVWDPDALYQVMCEQQLQHPELRFMITEHGIIESNLKDTRRVDFLWKVVSVLQAAQAHGMKLAGYIYWSCIDTWEWGNYHVPFGLIFVDFTDATLPRTIRQGGFAFRDIINTSNFVL